MDFLSQYLKLDPVAHAVLVISGVASFGLFLGSLKFRGVNFGIAGVLFSGLIFGHFQITIEPAVLEFIRAFGLILFVYTIGMQVGPGFFDSIRRDGLKLNLLAALVVVLGVLITICISFAAKIDMAAAAGMFSGGTTNTSSLAAVQQALKDMPNITPETLKLPGISYAVAYPFGVIGIILTMLFFRWIFRVNPQKEAISHSEYYESALSIIALNLEVQNPKLDGLTVKEIPQLNDDSGIVLSRHMHGQEMMIPQADSVLHVHDLIRAVGPKAKIKEFAALVGAESKVDLTAIQSKIVARRIIITKKKVIGRTLEDLNLPARFGVRVTRVSRAEIEFAASPDFRVQFGDSLLMVGEEKEMDEVGKELGNSPKHLNYPHIISIFVGIIIGVIVGSIPIYLPGITMPFKLGLAAGPLIVAILLSRIGNIGPLIWYMPIGANFMLREFGIVLFLACVGLRSGDEFVKTLIEGQGFTWMAWATLITLVPILLVGLLGRYKFKMNYLSLCGLLAGSMTSPPGLAFANSLANSNAPSISYATVYPLVMLLRVISAQVLVLLFVK